MIRIIRMKVICRITKVIGGGRKRSAPGFPEADRSKPL
jgi:hypothetical protein